MDFVFVEAAMLHHIKKNKGSVAVALLPLKRNHPVVKGDVESFIFLEARGDEANYSNDNDKRVNKSDKHSAISARKVRWDRNRTSCQQEC